MGVARSTLIIPGVQILPNVRSLLRLFTVARDPLFVGAFREKNEEGLGGKCRGRGPPEPPFISERVFPPGRGVRGLKAPITRLGVAFLDAPSLQLTAFTFVCGLGFH
jgi:hypothetical protein